MVIGSDGVAREIVVERGIDSGLDLNAVQAVRHWRFQPAMRNGQPVAVKAAIAVNYRLR
jgi:TonB family protein